MKENANDDERSNQGKLRRTKSEDEMNTNDYVERAMELCGVTDSRNRNVFAKYFGKLSGDQCEEVLETFTQKLSEGFLDHSPAYLTGMLKRKIDEAQECAPRNSDLEDPGRDGACDGFGDLESEDSASEYFESEDAESGGPWELQAKLDRMLKEEGPRFFKNLSPNAHLYGAVAHIYVCSQYLKEKPTCRLAYILGGIEALVFGRLISYPMNGEERSAGEEATISDEQRAAKLGFHTQVSLGWAKYPYGCTHKSLDYTHLKELDERIDKDPEFLGEFRLY